ncbi:MAG: hypothetical protein AAFX78_02470 [Cyanobacteria bacterium J06638_20]
MATFPILPDSITETWSWSTDVISTWDGSESRLSLQPDPRVEQSLNFEAVTQSERRAIMQQLAVDLKSPDAVPLFGWGARLTAGALSGSNVIDVNTTVLSLNESDRLVLLNPDTGQTESFLLSNVTDAQVTLASNLSQDVDQSWFAYKAMLALISNDTSFSFQTIAGQFSASMESWQNPYVQRTGTAASLTLFNSLPVLDREALSDATENLQFEREIVDFGLGQKVLAVSNTNLDIRLRRRFRVDRVLDPSDVDYWRLFLDTVRGNWKAFLLSTQLDDMELQSPLVPAATTMTLVDDLSTDFHAFASFQNFEIVYEDGTLSRHTITDSQSNGVVTFAPALPNDSKVANVKRISYLLKVRMADTQTWRHGPVRSELAFDVFTTDDG